MAKKTITKYAFIEVLMRIYFGDAVQISEIVYFM